MIADEHARVEAFNGSRLIRVLVVWLVMVGQSEVRGEGIAQYRPGEIVIKFKASLTQCAHCLLETGQAFASALTDGSPDVDLVNDALGVSRGVEVFFARHGMDTTTAEEEFLDEVDRIRARYPARTRRIPEGDWAPPTGMVNVYKLFLPAEADPMEACQLYLRTGHVEWCQPNYIVQATQAFVPNDPFYHSRGSFGQGYADLWGLWQMRMDRAWATTRGEGVVVAVVDTGLDFFHPDMAGNIWINPGEITGNGVDDDRNGKIDDTVGWDFVDNDNVPWDFHGHGTHVAGTIAAVGNNELGIIGVAPGAKIMAVRGLDEGGSGDDTELARALLYAAEMGAEVINNSWGHSFPVLSVPVLEDAVRTVAGMGVVVVFAAGNAGKDVFFFSPVNMST